MNGTVLGVTALGLVLVCLWVWMNILLLRPRRRADNSPADTAASQAATTSGAASRSVKTVVPSPTDRASARDNVQTAAQALVASAAADAQQETSVSDSTLEVLEHRLHRKGVFDRDEYPFLLASSAVPEFRESGWLQSFRRLSEDQSILGWIAFHQQTLGAADRSYDADFLDSLRSYRRGVETLQRQVGLSSISESSIVGSEGRVWFLSPTADIWLALFVDLSVDLAAVDILP